MKTIKIRALQLTNFKGIRSLKLNEISDETFIYGHNGLGKTTIFDAFTWLMFGKDSSDRKAFEVQTLDAHNNIIPKIEAVVSAILDVDGERVELTRIMRQKWVKRKGSLEAEYTGNETVYEWNGVPMNASEFTSKINTIIDEKVFKMITNPAAFNSLKWQDQRSVLIDMSGNITDTDVAKGNDEFENLLKQLIGKSFDERKKEVKANILKSKKELQAIPTRIDEVERSKPEGLDFENISKQLEEKESSLNAINDQITDELKAQQAIIDKKSEIKRQIEKLDHKVSDIKHTYRTQAKDVFRKQNSGKADLQRQLDERNAELTTATNALETLKSRLENKKKEMDEIAGKMMEMRNEWGKINAEPISYDLDESCPTCKQSLPEDKIESKKAEMENSLKAQKQSRLNAITQKGNSLKETQEAMSKERDDLQLRIENGTKRVGEISGDANKIKDELKSVTSETVKTEEEIFNELFLNDTEIEPIQKEVEKLSNEFENIGGVNVDGFKSTRDQISKEIGQLKLQLQKQQQIKQSNTRIDELSKEESNLAQAIADLEREMFTMEEFEKEKSTRIEQSVNSRFRLVNFKLFETQINGAEIPTCKALINGVPFSDANTASKINAGLDIINTLCMHYKASAPVFIDNRESVVELIPTESQVINLVVSEADKKLRVLSVGEVMETETV